MKKLLILLMFVLSLSLVAGICEVKCVEQAGTTNFCSVNSGTCVYDIKEGTGCPESGSLDNDGDHWDNGCDAFSEDPNEQVDLDADGYGHNYDCNDLNPGKTTECKGSGGGGGGTVIECTPKWECDDWSFCENNEKTRTCTKTNTCDKDTNKPAESQWCYIPTFTKDTEDDTKLTTGEVIETEPETEVEEVVEPVEEDSEGLGDVTGEVTGGSIGVGSMLGNILILLLIGLLIFLFVWKRGKKKEPVYDM